MSEWTIERTIHEQIAMPLDEIIRRQAINAAFIAEWKKAANYKEQPRIVGDMPDEVPFQCKAPKKARGPVFGASIPRPNEPYIYEPTDK